jgi:hypothetical protein
LPNLAQHLGHPHVTAVQVYLALVVAARLVVVDTISEFVDGLVENANLPEQWTPILRRFRQIAQRSLAPAGYTGKMKSKEHRGYGAETGRPAEDYDPSLTDRLAVQGFVGASVRLPARLRWAHRIEARTERLVHLLRRWAAVELLQIIASFGIIWSACMYVTGGEERERAASLAAWQILNAAYGKTTDGGRSHALRTLIDGDEVLAGLKLDSVWLVNGDLSW